MFSSRSKKGFLEASGIQVETWRMTEKWVLEGREEIPGYLKRVVVKGQGLTQEQDMRKALKFISLQ